MANWNTLKTAVADVINANGDQAITGQLLQNVLNNIITNVGENATFAGIATLDTNPGAPDGPVFYLATTAGVYPNFNGLEVLDGEAIIFLWNNSAWTKKVTGFATQEELSELGSEMEINKLSIESEVLNREQSINTLFDISDNLYDGNIILGYYNINGEYIEDKIYSTIVFQCESNQTYAVSSCFGYITEYNKEGLLINGIGGLGAQENYSFKTSKKAVEVKITVLSSIYRGNYIISKGLTVEGVSTKHYVGLKGNVSLNGVSLRNGSVSKDKVSFILKGENLFNYKDSNNIENGYYNDLSGIITGVDGPYKTILFECEQNKEYTISSIYAYITYWTKNGEFITMEKPGIHSPYSFVAKYNGICKITVLNPDFSTYMVVEGVELPLSYKEYGYYLSEDIKVKTDGTNKNNDIYLFGWFGQSNADGRGNRKASDGRIMKSTKPSNMPTDAILIKDDGNGECYVTKGVNIADSESSIPSFIKTFNSLSGKNVAVVKYSKGGTSLVPSDAESWNPLTTGANLYNRAKNIYLKSIQYLKDLGYNVINVGFIWIQGENEGTVGNNLAEEYKEVFQNLIQSFRTDMIEPNLKCFISLLGAYNSLEDKDVDKYQFVRKAQLDVAESDINTVVASDIARNFVSWKDNYMQDDQHYSSEGYIKLGSQIANNILVYI